MKKSTFLLYLGSILTLFACSNATDSVTTETYPNVITAFAGKIDLNNLFNYANQSKTGLYN